LIAIAATLGIGIFLSVLDSAIVGVAYPAIEEDFGATGESTQWVTTAYKLAQGIVIPAAIWLCRRYGLSRMYLASLLAYAASSTLCAAATSLEQLVGFRVLQAIPGALTPIVCVGIIYTLLPEAAQSAALGIYAMIAISAPGFAPYLGGVLVEYVHWRAVFWLAVPIAFVGVAAALLVLPRPGAVPEPPPFDVPGFVCAAVASTCFLLVLSKGPQWGWTSYAVWGLLAAGVNAALLFVAVELRVRHPILNLAVFTLRPFAIAAIVLEIMFVGINSVISFLPVYLQQAQQLTPSHAGMVLIPQALAWILAIPLAGVLWQLIGAKRVTIMGLALMGGGTVALSQLTVDSSRPALMAVLSLRALGMGLVMIPMLGGAVSVLPVHLRPDGIAWRTIVQRTGAALGLAALSVLITVHRTQEFADRSGLLDLGAPYHIPELRQLHQRGPDGLLPLWQAVQVRSLTAAYGDAYLIIGLLTLAAIVVTCCATWPTPPRVSRRDLIEAGV
jgi:EmrB/QacA subfamily drug resistance transporter